MDRRFQTTIWAMIQEARDRRGPALDDLVRRYWEPVRGFVRRRGFSDQDAEDVAQEVLSQICRREFLERADATKGRFRGLLLTVTRHAIRARLRHLSTQRRGGGVQPIALEAEPAATPEEREDYDRLWAMHLLRSALARVRDLNAGYAEAIELHYFRDLPYRDIAAKLGKREHDVKNYIFQGKKRLKECLQQAIREYCSSAEEYRDELEDLSRYLP